MTAAAVIRWDEIDRLADACRTYTGGDRGVYLADLYHPWKLAMLAVLAELATELGCTCDEDDGRAGSSYIVIETPEGETVKIRLADHLQRYSGPVWSFETTDSPADWSRGLAAVRREIESLL